MIIKLFIASQLVLAGDLPEIDRYRPIDLPPVVKPKPKPAAKPKVRVAAPTSAARPPLPKPAPERWGFVEINLGADGEKRLYLPPDVMDAYDLILGQQVHPSLASRLIEELLRRRESE